MSIKLPMTRKQRMEVGLHLESLAEIFGDGVAVTIALHEIGNPTLNFTLTDGPTEELNIEFFFDPPKEDAQ